MDALFFDTVRTLFGGKLRQGQVDGMNKIIEYARENGISRLHLAYMLATVFHETARWMQPIREGARRFGTRYSDKAARNAVAVIHAKGIIRRNYALPDENGNSFYGRGLVQITHKYNYQRLGEAIGVDLANNPDLALDWETALKIMHVGMEKGMFTPDELLDRLSEIETVEDFTAARRIINNDVRKNGAKVARYADIFYLALVDYEPKEAPNGPSNPQSAWPPRWWPFRTD